METRGLFLKTETPLVKFSAETVVEFVVNQPVSDSLSAQLISAGMKLVSLPPVCANKDVKPSVIADWR
ncbi:hypothetical protein EBZ37_11315, partial [bacterium]|nr:hypothetical protein [bacterium]